MIFKFESGDLSTTKNWLKQIKIRFAFLLPSERTNSYYEHLHNGIRIGLLLNIILPDTNSLVKEKLKLTFLKT
jgi:hypothetical protein